MASSFRQSTGAFAGVPDRTAEDGPRRDDVEPGSEFHCARASGMIVYGSRLRRSGHESGHAAGRSRSAEARATTTFRRCRPYALERAPPEAQARGCPIHIAVLSKTGTWSRAGGWLLGLCSLVAPAQGLVDSRCPSGHGPFGSSAVAGGRVVCLVDHEAAGRYELFSVPATGGPAVKLSPAMADDRDVIRFAVSPDGASVAFTCDPVQWTRYELHTVSVAGGAARRISGEVAFDHDVDDFAWSSLSDQVIFRYGRNAIGSWNLYTVPVRGGPRLQLNPTPVLGGAVLPGFVVALGEVWYLCDCELDEVVEVYSASLQNAMFSDGFETGGTAAWR